MESLANQLGAPTAARKHLQADLLHRQSDYSVKRQRDCVNAGLQHKEDNLCEMSKDVVNMEITSTKL